MQALSPAGLADSDPNEVFESASPTTFPVDKSTCYRELPLCLPDIAISKACFSERPARKSNPPYGGLLSLTKIANPAGDRGAPDLRSASIVPHRPPQWGSVGAHRGLRASACGAEAPPGANRRRNYGPQQAPSYGGLTGPVRRSPIDATEPGPACRAGPPRGGCAVRGRCS